MARRPRTSFTLRSAVWIALALLAGACGDDAGPSGRGLEAGPAVERADAGASDGPGDAPSGAGDAAEVGRDAGAGAPPASSLSTGAGPACDSCERAQCGSGGGDLVAACLLAPGLALDGPKKGTRRAHLCAAVLACVRSSNCASRSVSSCYCGEGVSLGDCSAGKVSGPCRTAVEQATESADPKVVVDRLFNPSYANGPAFVLIERCDRELCQKVCLSGRLCPAGGSGGGPEAVCPDLDRNCAPDCRETLVMNPDLASDAAGWQAEPGVTAVHEARDAESRPGSGALAVTNRRTGQGMVAVLAGARQCLPVETGAAYQALAQVFIPSGQAGTGSAGLAATFHAAGDCGDPALPGSSLVTLAGKPDAWLVVSGELQAPAGARQLSLRLVVSKPFAGPDHRALFDNVLVSRR